MAAQSGPAPCPRVKSACRCLPRFPNARNVGVRGEGRSRAARVIKGVPLARHITLPLFMSTKRSRVITIAAAGTLTLATAISLAATLPSASAPAPASANAAYMIAISRQATAQTVRPAAASAQVSNFSQMRALQDKHVQELAAAERKAAAAKAAERKAAAAKAAAHRVAEQAAQQSPVQVASTAQTTQQQAQPVQQSAVTAPSGAPEQIAEQMLSQFGWSSSQFSCLQPLWQQESGWSVTAENPTSGAYGIAQALPGSKMASAGPDWQTDAATQIRWGLGYIQGQYGSPCGAWAHEEATGWY